MLLIFGLLIGFAGGILYSELRIKPHKIADVDYSVNDRRNHAYPVNAQ